MAAHESCETTTVLIGEHILRIAVAGLVSHAGLTAKNEAFTWC